MKKIIFIFVAFATFNMASAQTNNKMGTAPAQRTDTINAATKLEKTTDVKSMEAVKTTDHTKVTTQPKDTISTVRSSSTTKTKTKPKKQ